MMQEITIGSVVQINEKFPNSGWVGAFLVITKVTAEGIQGYLHLVRDRNNSGYSFIDCKFNEVELIGQAKIICIEDTISN